MLSVCEMGHSPIIFECETCPVCAVKLEMAKEIVKLTEEMMGKDDEISDMAGKIDSLENQLDLYTS